MYGIWGIKGYELLNSSKKEIGVPKFDQFAEPTVFYSSWLSMIYDNIF